MQPKFPVSSRLLSKETIDDYCSSPSSSQSPPSLIRPIHSNRTSIRSALPSPPFCHFRHFRRAPRGQPTRAMSLVNLSHVCSHLQNASLARLGLTSIPLSKLHLGLALHLQKQGFLATVNLGGPSPPAKLLPPSEPIAPLPHQAKASVLDEVEKVTQENRASRRLWLGMKYWDGEPVLKKMRMESKPTKRIWLDSHQLGHIVRGRDAQFIKGMRGVGECLFVSTDRGIMEARECVERKIGGMVLCRVW